MAVNVNYDVNSGIVLGYYPDNIMYNNIPEPYIKIDDIQHASIDGRTMCVINDVFQEYVQPISDQLLNVINKKQSQLNEYYASKNAWIITVIQGKNTLDNKDCNWWRDEAGSIINANITGYFTLYDSKNKPVIVNATPDIAKNIIIEQLVIRQAIFAAYITEQANINAIIDLDLAQNYDFMPAFKQIKKIISL